MTITHRAGRLAHDAALLALLLLPTLLLIGCPIPFDVLGATGPLELNATGSTVTLAWDPSGSSLPQSDFAAAGYRLYARERGSRGWLLVGEAEVGPNPTFTLQASDVMGGAIAGEFEFGVSSINRRGEESALHSSTDNNASPRGGWYLAWTQ